MGWEMQWFGSEPSRRTRLHEAFEDFMKLVRCRAEKQKVIEAYDNFWKLAMANRHRPKGEE